MKKLTCIFFAIFILLASIQGFTQDEDGLPLPFLEQWNTGTFGTNNWLPEGENWSINGNEGQPDPCAEFTWDPIQSDYSISLESDQFLADFMTEGRIYLDFDLKLDNALATGNEYMLVQVWNVDSQVWSTVSTYSNGDGSFGWVSENLDITSQAKGMVFKFRFTAQGENSLHIVSWFIDNIHVYRVCEGVSELTAECDTNLNAIRLYWNGPGGSDEWIQWDDGINYTAIGIGSPVLFDMAARWEPGQLSEFDGSSITEIAFFPNEESSTYRVRVWIGELAENLVVDQEVNNPLIGSWNYVTLDYPVPIDITQELWVGYQNDGDNGYQMGVDDGPAIDGYGNMINFGGWQTLLEINPAMDYNWNIAAHLVTGTGETILLNKGSRDLMGYNIYCRIDGGDYQLCDYTSGNVTYLDKDGELVPGTLYCFMVTAVYESATDQCESDFSNEACVVCETYVTEEESQINLNIYPNPASDVLFIESIEKIEGISIFDCRGITMEQWNNGTIEQSNSGTVEMPVDGLAPGLYLVHLETSRESVNRKIIIKH